MHFWKTLFLLTCICKNYAYFSQSFRPDSFKKISVCTTTPYLNPAIETGNKRDEMFTAIGPIESEAKLRQCVYRKGFRVKCYKTILTENREGEFSQKLESAPMLNNALIEFDPLFQ